MSTHPVLLDGTQLTFYDDFASEGGLPLCRVDWSTIEWQEALGSKGRGYARVMIPADSANASDAAIMNVVRIDQPRVGTAGVDSYEYRITELDDSNGTDLIITAQPYIAEFGRAQIRNVVGGRVVKTVTISAMTPTQIITDYVLPAMVAEGYSGLSIGTVSPTQFLTETFVDVTPLAILQWLESQTGYDAYVVRASESTWTINLATQGSGTAAPIAFVGRNVKALDRSITADDQFATRVEANGTERPEDVEASRCGQATWDATLVSGSTYTLADPVGGPGPIGATDQVTGKTALVLLDPLHWSTNANGPITVDSTRHVVWIGSTTAPTLYWQDVATGEIGTVAVGHSVTSITTLVYASGVDRLYVGGAGYNRVLVFNPDTKVETTTINVTQAATRLYYFPANGCLAVLASGGVRIINTTTNTIQGTLAGSGGGTILTYHTATNRYFEWGTSISAYNATTLALLTTFGLAGYSVAQVCPDPAAASLLFVTATRSAATLNPSTYALSAYTALVLTGNPTLSVGTMPFTATTAYIVSMARLFPLNRTTLAVSTTHGDIVDTLVSAHYYAVEPVAAPRYIFLPTQAGAVRRLWLDGANANAVPYEAATITACDPTAQTITITASGAGGPPYLASGARVQIRDDAALAYCTRLTDPTALATYGPIDAVPTYNALALTNYWHGGTFATADWRADGTLRWATPNTTTAYDYRWRAGDYTAHSGTAVTVSGTNAVGPTISVSGMTPGFVFLPGYALTMDQTTRPLTSPAYVRQRTVVGGGGTATIPVIGLGTVVAGTAYLFTPAFTLGTGRTDALMTFPSSVAPYATVPLPYITGDAVAWVVAHVQMWCNGAAPSGSATLYVYESFATAASTTVPEDTAVVSTGEVRDYWLAKRVDLTSAGFLVVGVQNPSTANMTMVRSLAVILSPGATADATIDVYGSEGANALWQLSNVRLLQGRDPSVNYRVEVIEDDAAAPFALGAATLLRDYSRSISATPRVISVTRYGTKADERIREPTIELSSAELSLLRSIVDLQIAR